MPQPARRNEHLTLILLVALAVAVLAWRWVGFQGADDESYTRSAYAWITHFPPLGTDHWALRYPLVLPMAAGLWLIGPGTLALALPNLTYYVAFLVLQYVFMRGVFGWRAAALASLVGILLPEFPVQATYANPDLPEMCMIMASAWCVLAARRPTSDAGGGFAWIWAAAAGVLAAIGFMLRETTLALLLVYLLLFLFRPLLPRLAYVVMAAGFLLTISGELTYFAARTGNPFYRQVLSAHNDDVDRNAKMAQAEAQGHVVNSEGVLTVSAWLAPIVVLFVSQKYGLLFYLAVPACFALLRGPRGPPTQRDALFLFSLLAVVSYLFVVLNIAVLFVVPRYFIVAAAAAAVPLCVYADRLWSRRPALAAILVAGYCVSNLGFLYLENVTPLWAEYQLVDAVRTLDGVVHTDPQTARRAAFPLRFAGLAGRVVATPPEPGDLVAVVPRNLSQCNSARCAWRADLARYSPAPGWRKLSDRRGPERWIGHVLRWAGLSKRLPPDLLAKIAYPYGALEIYRVPPA